MQCSPDYPGRPQRPDASLWKEPRPAAPRHRLRPSLDPPVWVWRIIIAVQAALGLR